MRLSTPPDHRIVPAGLVAALLGILLPLPDREPRAQHAFDFDEPPETDELISETLSYGVEVGLETRRLENLDLARPGADRTEAEPTLNLALSWVPLRQLRAFVDLELGHVYQGGSDGSDHVTSLAAKEAHLTVVDMVPGVVLQAGRLAFEDPHRWLYDDELDGVRVVWRSAGSALEASVSRLRGVDLDLLEDQPDDRATNLFVAARRRAGDDLIGSAYVLHRHDLEGEEDLTFLGIQATGQASGLDLRLDAAWVGGEVRDEGEVRDISGIGAGLVITRAFDLPLEPSLSVGVAFGSGDDDPDDGDDGAFRQTGLQSNEIRFGGLSRIATYGEVLAPELSNLWVGTLAAGVRPNPESSIDVVWHLFRRDELVGGLRDSGLEVEPEGGGRYLGQELDLVLSYAGIEDLEAELTLGAFLPSEAFAGDAPAWLVGLEVATAF